MVIRRIVVTGVGGITSLGDIEQTWQAMLSGKSAISQLPAEFDICPTHIGGWIEHLDLARWFPGRTGTRIQDRAAKPSQFAHVAAAQALSMAGLLTEHGTLPESLQEATGMCIGTGVGPSELIGQMRADMDRVRAALTPQEYQERMQELVDNHRGTIMKVLPDAVAYQPSMAFQTRGPTDCSIKACATGAGTIRRAALEINAGQATIMVAGGTESLAPEDVMAFNVYGTRNANSIKGALSKRNNDPKGASRPFDQEHDGFVPAEGAGILILESLEQALERDAPILAELAGFGETTDAKGATDPEKSSQVRAMRMALHAAGLVPSAINLVKTHGTSTIAGDASELEAIEEVFGKRGDLFLWPPKSQLGHTMGASGALEAALAIIAMRKGFIPPTLNFTNPIAQAQGFTIPTKQTSAEIEAVLCNAFGFGGQNVCLVFKRWEE